MNKSIMIASIAALLSTSAIAATPANSNNSDTITTSQAGATANLQATTVSGAVASNNVDTKTTVNTTDVNAFNATANNSADNRSNATLNGAVTGIVAPTIHTGGATSGSFSEGGQGGSATSGSDSRATANTGPVTATTGASTSGASSEGQRTAVTVVDNVEAQKRAPVNTAVSYGAAGTGTCRFGPGVGAQFVQAGGSLSLPIFKDADCRNLSYFGALMAAGQTEAAVQFLSRVNRDVNAAVTIARTAR